MFNTIRNNIILFFLFGGLGLFVAACLGVFGDNLQHLIVDIVIDMRSHHVIVRDR